MLERGKGKKNEKESRLYGWATDGRQRHVGKNCEEANLYKGTVNVKNRNRQVREERSLKVCCVSQHIAAHGVVLVNRPAGR